MNKSLGGTASNSIPDSKRIKKYPFWESRLNIQTLLTQQLSFWMSRFIPEKESTPGGWTCPRTGWQSGWGWIKKQFIPI
jgi:hypothetical protein